MCPVALHGSKLPGGKEINKGKLRGVESQRHAVLPVGELGLTAHDFPNAIEDGISGAGRGMARWAQDICDGALAMDDTVRGV